MAIKKNWKHPYFTEFQYGSFFDIKINPGGLLCFCFVSAINKNMMVDVKICNSLIQKAKI